MPGILINFANVTIPTPQPFDKNQPEQNRENMAYIVAQILQELKTNGFTLTFPETSTVTGDLTTLLTQIKEALDALKYNDEVIELGNLLIHHKGVTIEELS